MAHEAAGERELASHLLGDIVERADGIPLFIEELTKALLDPGLAESAADLPRVPETLQDLLTARLDRLPIDKEVAKTAACIGREFPHRLLAAVTEKPEATLQSTLDLLAKHRSRLVDTRNVLGRKDSPPKS